MSPSSDPAPAASRTPTSERAKSEALAELATLLKEGGYGFVTPTPLTHATVNARPGTEVAASLRDVFGWNRPFRPGLLPERMRELMVRGDVLHQVDGLEKSAVRFSTLGDLLIMHSSFPTADRDAVFFGPDTYKFVDAVRAQLGSGGGTMRRAADLCTGAGPAALTIAAGCPDCEVSMVDINDRALFFAETNAAVAGLGNATARRSDLLNDLDGTFDLITAHPPYLMDRGQRTYRHGGGSFGEALAGRIVAESIERLSAGGTLLLFTGVAIVDGADALRGIVDPILRGRDDLVWNYREVDPDVFGEELAQAPYDQADRIALVVLTVTNGEGRR